MRALRRREALRMAGLAGLAGAAGALGACGRPSKNPGPVPSGTPSPAASAASRNWSTLARELRGPLLQPRSEGYVSAARLYNARFDAQAHPAAVARCADAGDVAACVRFAADAGVPFALRSGGHSYGGWSTSTGLVVDVSTVDTVSVDGASATARIGAGARLVDVYTALARRGVAIAGGSCPTVGITGLALGGGIGVLSRAFGLTCDAVRALDVVTADGRASTVDASHQPDLYWALRGGGGGSFAAVTGLTVADRPAPTVHTYFYAWDLSHAPEVLAGWQRWVPGTDRRLWSTCKLLADPGPGRLRASVAGTWIGPAGELSAQLAPLLAGLPSPVSTAAHSLNYASAMLFEAGCSGDTAAQCVSAALSSRQRQPFAATSSIVADPLPPAAIDAAIGQVRAALNVADLVEGGVSFDALGGAVAEVAPDATAFPYRRALATVQYTATWQSGATPAGRYDTYVRGFRAAMGRWLGESAYVNYPDSSISDYAPAYWADNADRLRAVKRAVDPHRLFNFPQAVPA